MELWCLAWRYTGCFVTHHNSMIDEAMRVGGRTVRLAQRFDQDVRVCARRTEHETGHRSVAAVACCHVTHEAHSPRWSHGSGCGTARVPHPENDWISR